MGNSCRCDKIDEEYQLFKGKILTKNEIIVTNPGQKEEDEHSSKEEDEELIETDTDETKHIPDPNVFSKTTILVKT